MAKAIIILEDKPEGVGATVTVDFEGKHNRESCAHRLAVMAAERLLEIAEEQGVIVHKSFVRTQ